MMNERGIVEKQREENWPHKKWWDDCSVIGEGYDHQGLFSWLGWLFMKKTEFHGFSRRMAEKRGIFAIIWSFPFVMPSKLKQRKAILFLMLWFSWYDEQESGRVSDMEIKWQTLMIDYHTKNHIICFSCFLLDFSTVQRCKTFRNNYTNGHVLLYQQCYTLLRIDCFLWLLFQHIVE